MSYSSDPLSLVQKAMHEGLSGSQAVRNVVGNWQKNIVGFSDKETDPRRDNVDESDLPEVVQILAGGTAILSASSSHVNISQVFDIQLNSGSFALVGDKGLCALQFAVYCALLELEFGATFNAIQWAGERIIGDVIITSATSSESNGVINRGINGWTTIVAVTVTMNLSRKAMLDYNTSGEMP